MAEPILNQPHFQDEDKAREYLENLRWANGVICPHCGSTGAHYRLEGESHRKGLYKCTDCRDQFTVTVGTVFERSKIKLHIWLQAVHLMCASKKGISAKQMERMLGVTYKTAWFMAHRIRESMDIEVDGPLGSTGGAVEADETFWGNAKKKPKSARGYDHKMKVVSLVERDGKKRSFHVANVTAKTVTPILREQIAQKARLMTDESSVYTKVGKEFAQHGVVNHSSGEYAKGDITTNTVESSFAILKRGLYGTFHHVSEKHLQRYATEFDFRWNTREKLGFSDVQRMAEALKNISGKRLTYRRTNTTA
ncbi:MAG: IS1595 family transposase [Betaproteobacteria bacterium]|nr:IS1595 family transposase [Betaproteobacteria bacterium]